ncbi:MAG: hypothetical protein ABIK19_00585 [candidate division WOR-3 bacterium]
MELYQKLIRLRRQFQFNEILFVCLWILSILVCLLFVVVGLFINKLILLLLIPILTIIIYKSDIFISIKQLSKKIENYFPEIKNKLLPVVELYYDQLNNRPTKEGYSLELIEAAIKDITEKIKTFNLIKIINYRKTLYVGILTLGLCLTFITFRLFQPENFDFGWRLAFKSKQDLIDIQISPGNTYVNKDSVVKINYKIHLPVKTLRAKLHINKQVFSEDEVAIKAEKKIEYYVGIYSVLGFRVYKTQDYYIKINQPIEITDLSFIYNYPAYTKLPPQQSRSTLIKAIKGTKVEFHGIATMPLTAAWKITSADKRESLKVRDNEFEGSFVITKQDSFVIILTGENYYQGKSQTCYIVPTVDEMPFVKIFLPGRDIDMPVSMQVLVGIYGIDDFGISRFELYCRKASADESVRIWTKLANNRLEDTAYFFWDLTKLNILPGEAVDYYAVVYDNDAISGNKHAKSETYTIRFPTLTEIYEQASQESKTTVERLQPLSETQMQLNKELQKISEHIQKYRDLDWEEKSKLTSLLAQQERIMNEIAKLQQEIQNTMADLYSNLMLDKETIDRLKEISEILSEILPEEIKEHLEKLQSALMEKNPELQKQLENFKMSAEEMKEALKRALELLKNIQQQELLNKLARKAEEIYKQQSQLNSRMNAEKLANLVSPQEQIENEIKDLEDEIKNSSLNFEDSVVRSQLAEIAQELTELQLSSQANNVSNNLSQGKRSEAKKSAQHLLSDLAKLKDRLKDILEKFAQNKNQYLTTKLTKIAIELNEISHEQEKVMLENQQSLSASVLKQKQLAEATTIVAESLAALSAQTLLISPRLTKEIVRSASLMTNAANLLEEIIHTKSSLTPVKNLQTEAIFSLDIVTWQILLLTAKAEKSAGMAGGLEGLLEALSQLTADQMTLGQEMGGMIPLPIPGGLTAEQLAQLNRLFSLQSQLRSALEQLLQEMKSGKYGEMPGLTGSVEGAVEEMKQIEKDLSELTISRKTIERQEQVINRLLDAQRSIRQKEFSEKREREIGKDYPPPKIVLDKSLGESKKQLREELLRALREGYPKEYEFLIKKYFEELIRASKE